MPSGSKKRKSFKKSRPQGDPPELDAGFAEGAMGEEIGEATPSPRGIEGDPEAMAERGFEGKEVNGEVPQEGDVESESPKQDFRMDEGAPDQELGSQGDPPSQAHPEPEIPPVIEAEAPAVLEIEGETAQRETDPQIDTTLGELDLQTDATSEEIKPELESDATPLGSEPVLDVTSDVSPDEIKPDADIGLDETESSKKQSTPPEREFDSAPAPIGNDSAMDEPLVEIEPNTDAASADIQPEFGKGPDELLEAAPAEVELEIGKPLEADAVSSIELETNEALDEASVEPELGLAPAKTEPEVEVKELEIAAPADIEPETKEASMVTELVTDTHPKDVEAEAEEGQVEELETATPAIVEPEAKEALMERELVTDASPIDVESEVEEDLAAERESAVDAAEAQAEKLETAVPAIIEPETEELPMETELVTDASPIDVEAEVEQALAAERESPIDAVEAQVEELETAAPAIIEPETEEGPTERELESDASPIDVEADVEEALVAERESTINAAEAQVEELETAAPAIIEPETEEGPMERELVTDASPADVEVEVEEALAAERESTIDAATAEVEPETNATPVDTEAERDTAQEETDASHEEVPPVMDAASLKIEAETDVAAREFELEPDTAVVELEPSTEVNPVEIEPEMSETPDEARQDEVSQAETEATPKPEPGVEVLVHGESEARAEDVDNSLEIEAKTELPRETEPESKPLDLAEDTSLQPLQEIKPESEAEAIDEAKPEDDALVGTKAEEGGSVETESDQQDFVEGELEAPSQIIPEPELETTRGIELEAEAEVPVEAEPESVLEAPAEAEPDEKGFTDAESDKQDLVVIEADQSDAKPYDEQLQQQAGEAEIAELDPSVCEDNQPSESQLQSAPEVLVTEYEPPAISAPDEANLINDSIPSTSSSEASNNTDRKRTVIEQELEKGDVPLSATTIEGERESTEEVISENQDTGANAVGNEQGATDELPRESKDFTEEQEKAVDVRHDEDGTVVASHGNGGETEESIELELAIELPPADVIDVEESATEQISEQERAIDVGHGQDGAVSASAGKGGEAELSSEQELGIEMPSGNVVDVEEPAKEEPPPSDEAFVIKQPQPVIDEQDLSVGLGAAVDEPLSAETEQSLNATLPSFESEMTSDACERQDEAVTLVNEGDRASEQEFTVESATGELERDVGEEEAASSTVAEVGSVINDFDDRASYAQEELPTDFPCTDQDVDIPDCKEFDDISSTEAPEPIETVSRDQLASEPPPAEKVDVNTVFGLAATSDQREVLLEKAGAAKPGAGVAHSAPVKEMSRVEQMPSSPQAERVVQDNGKDKVHASNEVVLENEEPRSAEAERSACEDDKVAANSILGTSFPVFAGDELISKAFRYFENGRPSLSSSGAPSNELVEHRDESGIHQSEAINTDKAEIRVMDSKDLKEAECNPMGGDTSNDTDKAPVESDSSITEGRDVKGVQSFRQENTREASLPVVFPAQDRTLEQVNLNSAEQPSGNGTLKRRTTMLDCCGMFDLLLRKN